MPTDIVNGQIIMTYSNTGLLYKHFGQPIDTLTLTTLPIADLRDDQVLVAMQYTPVNPSDLIPVTGAYRHRINLPSIAGYEGIGIVVANGNKHDKHLINRRVLPLRGQGTWQKYVICNTKDVILVPDHISDHIAARAYINPLAAHLLLKQAQVKDHDIVITAASAQCAQLIGSWAKKQGAKNIYGITSHNTHHDLLEQLDMIPLLDNAPHTFNIIKNATRIYDAVGGSLADQLLNNANKNALFFSYGLLSGQPITAFNATIKPIRFHLRDHINHASNEVWHNWFTELWPMLNSVHLPTSQIFSYKDWQQALHAFYQRDRACKPILCWID